MVAICLDVGTSVVKAVAFDDNGTEIAVTRESVPIARTRPGWSEQDMQAVWNAVKKTIRGTAAQVADDVQFLSVTAQGDGCWLIDEAGNPTGPAILWNDGRASSLVEHWRTDGTLEKTFRLNGTGVFPGSQSAILRWLQQHDPEHVERSTMAFYCKDWVVFNLTGERFTDETDGSFPFFDIRKRQYSDELLRLYGLEWAQRLLAPVHASNEPVGSLRATIATELGLPSGIPVIAAPYDIASTAIGLGAVNKGQAVSILGTTLCNEIVTDEVHTSGTPTGLMICSGRPDYWLRGFATMCGTEALDWLCQLFNLNHASELIGLAEEVEPGAGGVLFLPYLSPAGERAPFLNSNARATMFGLSLEQSKPHVARAAVEGLTFVIRECFEAASVKPTELNVCGGGALSDLWCTMIADVTGLPVRTSTDSEVGAKGAFFMGLVATGRETSIEEAAPKYVKTRKLYEPHAAYRSRYDDLYTHFLKARNVAAEIWPQLAEIRLSLEQAVKRPTH